MLADTPSDGAPGLDAGLKFFFVSLEVDLDHTLSSFLKIKSPEALQTELRGDTARFHPNSRKSSGSFYALTRLHVCLREITGRQQLRGGGSYRSSSQRFQPTAAAL